MMSNNDKEQNHFCGYKFCRGTQGACKYSLVEEQAVIEGVRDLVIKATVPETMNKSMGNRQSQRPALRIAMAACPNACTEPQIKDIGIIAVKFPTDIGSECNGCGRCREVCREGAIEIVNNKAQLMSDKCVACGQCISECPTLAINSEHVRFRILVGGRMGRHPRWAEQLCVVDSSDLAKVIQGFLDRLSQFARPGERAASVVERLGIAGLREEKSANV